MAYMTISKIIVPSDKTSFTKSDAAKEVYNQCAADGVILAEICNGARWPSPHLDEPKVSGTIFRGSIWVGEDAYNTYINNSVVQEDNAQRDAYNTLHGIIRTEATLTI